MHAKTAIEEFIDSYPAHPKNLSKGVREFLLNSLPDVSESLYLPAKVIGYGYGARYKGMVCTIIMSQSEVKIGTYRGTELSDPTGLLQGTGKIHRCVRIRDIHDLDAPELKILLELALAAARKRTDS